MSAAISFLQTPSCAIMPKQYDTVRFGGAVMARRASSISVQPSTITARDVEDCLRHAGAVEPWNSEGVRVTAFKLNWLRERLAETKTNPPQRTAFDRAQAAIDELRRVLPELKGWYALPLPEGVDEQYQVALQQGRDQLDRLDAALFDVQPRGKPNLLEGSWHERAVNCFQGFWLATGTGAISKNGPACRFVQAALELIGDGRKPLGTIEQALRREDAVGSIEKYFDGTATN